MKKSLLFILLAFGFGHAELNAQLLVKGEQYSWDEFQAGDSLLLANATVVANSTLPDVDLDNCFLSSQKSRCANYWNGLYTLGVLQGLSEDNIFILRDAPDQVAKGKSYKSYYLQHAETGKYLVALHNLDGSTTNNHGTSKLDSSIEAATSFTIQNSKAEGDTRAAVNKNSICLAHYEDDKAWRFGPFWNYSFTFYTDGQIISWNAYKVKWVPERFTQTASFTTNKAVGEEITMRVFDQKPIRVDWGDGEWSECQPGEITGVVKGSSITIEGSLLMSGLVLSGCGLTAIDLSDLPNLVSLLCAHNELESIDISNNPKLLELDIASNKFSEFSYEGDVLEYLDCSNNNLSTLSVTKITGLQHLYCGGNKLSKLNVSRNKLLKTLWCQDNSLTTLDLSACAEIQSVYASRNKLTSITASENSTSLVDLWCDDNEVAELTASEAAPLTLNVANNQLKYLDIKKPSAGYKPYLIDQSNNQFCMSDIYAAKYISNYFIEPQAKVQVEFEEIPVGEVIDFTKYMKNANNVACDIDFYTEGGRKLIAGNEGVGDYYKRGANITFWTAFPSIYFTVTQEQYPGFASVSLPFMVGDGSGVCEVQSDGMKPKDVYTVGGVKVQNSENLPQGIYIINGKKVVK